MSKSHSPTVSTQLELLMLYEKRGCVGQWVISGTEFQETWILYLA